MALAEHLLLFMGTFTVQQKSRYEHMKKHQLLVPNCYYSDKVFVFEI